MSAIYKSVFQIMKLINAIGKDQTNTIQKYKFRGIDDVYNELHGHFAACDIINIPRVLERKEEQIKTDKGSLMIRVLQSVEYDLIAGDGSKITIGPIWGEASDYSDKATNKSLSAAHKYALIQTFLIPTNDAEDADRDHNTIKFDTSKEPLKAKEEPKKDIKPSETKKEIVNHAPQSNFEAEKKTKDIKEAKQITYRDFTFAKNHLEFPGKRFDEINFIDLCTFIEKVSTSYEGESKQPQRAKFFDMFNEFCLANGHAVNNVRSQELETKEKLLKDNKGGN